MDLPRREVLKLLVASAAAGIGQQLLGCAHVAGASTWEGNATMNSRPLLTLKLATAPIEVLGAVPLGTRMIFPITGGDFEGPRLRGKVLPGGADWALLRSDGVLELDLRITLETDDAALIHLSLIGMRHGPPEVIAALGRGEAVDPARYYFRTASRFETASTKYAFLNRTLAVGAGENRPSGLVHLIEELL